ncbi:hypothetical protein LMG24238_00812 [Paraburkholderia sediminicola]|uniref:Uncharacterized protein n=1 Tax=Paraburkholderia sediminicola TaxID=458836 RepID=A0A6J4ZXN4_9BURK|nr:hypothetical protein LMG24238_00812 [Paraburkholderia sediminicola]
MPWLCCASSIICIRNVRRTGLWSQFLQLRLRNGFGPDSQRWWCHQIVSGHEGPAWRFPSGIRRRHERSDALPRLGEENDALIEVRHRFSWLDEFPWKAEICRRINVSELHRFIDYVIANNRSVSGSPGRIGRSSPAVRGPLWSRTGRMPSNCMRSFQCSHVLSSHDMVRRHGATAPLHSTQSEIRAVKAKRATSQVKHQDPAAS